MRHSHIDRAEVHKRAYGELILLAGNTDGKMRSTNADLKILRIKPGESTSHHLHLVAESLFHVLDGEVICRYGHSGKVRLRKGETFIITPREAHALRNAGKGTAVVLEVESPPHASSDKSHVGLAPSDTHSRRNLGRFWRKQSRLALKICGINNFDTAIACLQLGVDAIGIHAVKRQRPDERVRGWSHWLQAIPDDLSIFLLTDVTEIEELSTLAMSSNCDTVQLQGEKSVDQVIGIASRIRARGWKFVKSIGVQGACEKDILRYATAIAPSVDAILFDTSYKGGTGLPHNWQASGKMAERVRAPIILAGGLNAQNLKTAVSTVLPFGVDVESGVEVVFGDQGKPVVKAKSYQKIADLVQICETTHGGYAPKISHRP